MFVSFFPQPKLFFSSAAIWSLAAILFWFFGGEQLGAVFGLPPAAADAPPIIGIAILVSKPFLWFYVGRRDSGRQRRSEGTVCREFLERCFTRSATQKKLYLKASTGLYQASPKLVDYPGTHPNEVCRRVIESHARQPQRPMGAVFDEFGLSRDFMTTNKLRLYLTTSSFPFLISA